MKLFPNETRLSNFWKAGQLTNENASRKSRNSSLPFITTQNTRHGWDKYYTFSQLRQ
jgi:hypothetical protein